MMDILAPQERAPFTLMSLLGMLEHYATRWFLIAQVINSYQYPVLDATYDQADRDADRVNLHRLAEECRDLGLTLSCTAIRRLEQRLVGEEFSKSELTAAIGEIQRRITDELEGILFFYVPRERGHYYSSKLLFGPDVDAAFPDTGYDIEEAGKCLALGRGTACVFHLMRVMEALLKDLAKKLRIPYAPSWESYLTQIEKNIGAKHKTKGIRWKRDEPYFRDVLGDLRAVKIAWRNPTMHVVRKYTIEESEDVFRAVRGFARRLCDHVYN